MSHDGPSSGEPEYLSSDAPTTPLERSPRRGRRPALLIGGAVAIAGLAGGAAWAWSAYSSTGPQPSEALPADTLGYAAIDLDPSGKQKIAAIRMLRQFPAFRDEVDLDTDDDLRERFVEEALADADCDLDYAEDVEPWLGQRFAVAAVPGEEKPDPVFVLQVNDSDAADAGLTALRDCGDGSDEGAWEIRGDWAVVAETAEVAEATADAATDSALADDGDYQQWTGAAGDPGILTAYAAPAAGAALGELLTGQGLGALGAPGLPTGSDPLSPDELPSDGVPPELEQAFEDFGGAALAVRFADGALEVEVATAGTEDLDYASEDGADVVSTLPEDTAVALGFGFSEGWGEVALDNLEQRLGPDAADALAFVESQLGLALPEDLETVLGESMALSLGGDFDAAALAQTPDGSDVPVGAKIRGDAEGIEDVLDKLQAAAGPGGDLILGTDSEGDVVAVGPNEDYRAELLEEGDLGGSDAYEGVVRESDRATAVFFVNFDVNDWLDSVVRQQGDAGLAENIEPLEAAGVSAWQDGEDNHVLFRLTTEG